MRGWPPAAKQVRSQRDEFHRKLLRLVPVGAMR